MQIADLNITSKPTVITVASLGWVTPGVATEGVTPLFFLKNLATFLVASSAGVSLDFFFEKLTTFFAHRFIAFYCFHSGVTPSRVSPYTFFTCPTSFIHYSL